MSVVTTIPKEKAKAFVRRLTEALSGNHDIGKVDMIGSLNRQLAGWAAFYRFADFTARAFRRIDHVVFWKLAHWLAQKYRSRIKPLMRNWYRAPETGQAKTWLVYGRNERGERVGKALRRMVSWAKIEWRAVCAERCTYGSGRRSAKALLTPRPMARGFVYLAAVVDVFSRRVLSHRVSITMEAVQDILGANRLKGGRSEPPSGSGISDVKCFTDGEWTKEQIAFAHRREAGVLACCNDNKLIFVEGTRVAALSRRTAGLMA